MFKNALSRYVAFRSRAGKSPTRSRPTANAARPLRRSAPRSWGFEQLESRLAMAAEGVAVSVDQFIDASGLAGPLTAEVAWGDGTRTPVAASEIPSSTAVRFQFDYSLDTEGFFNSPSRRAALEAAGRSIASSLNDSLLAISPSGENTWTPSIAHPATGNRVNVPLTTVPAGVLYVYAGGRDLPSGQLAVAGPGNNSARGTPAWLDVALARGQAGARDATPTDFGPWGGVMAFDTLTNWYAEPGDESIAANQQDLFTVAAHELMHVLGFGTAKSWVRNVSGASFTGEASRSANGGVHPLLADSWHWSSSTIVSGRDTLMRPDSTPGRRRVATRLDLAGLDDIGWDVLPTSTRVSGAHVFGDNGVYPAQLIVRGSTPGRLQVDLPAFSIANAPPTVTTGGTFTVVAGQPLPTSQLAAFTDPGFGASETFHAVINWGDSSPESAAAATVVLPGSAGVATRGVVNGSHLYAAPGTYRGMVRVVDDDGDAGSAAFTVNVVLPRQLLTEISVGSIGENAGAAAVLTVQALNFPADQPIVVSLASSDHSEAMVPLSVVIPAGQTRVQVPVNAVDDALLDGTAVVTLSASVVGVGSASSILMVTDHETVRLDLSRGEVREDAGAGAVFLRLTRSNTDIGLPLLVSLESSDPSSARVPAAVVIPAAAAYIDVGLEVLDDATVDGDRHVRLIAFAGGYAGGEGTLRVADYEPLSIAASALSIFEGDPIASSVTLTVQTPPMGGGLRVYLSTDSPADVQLPAFVDVPLGASSATVQVSMVSDRWVEPRELITITASGPGFVASSVTLRAVDDDRDLFTNPADPYNVNVDDVVSPLDVLSIINAINTWETGSVDRIAPESVDYIDVNADGQLTPLDLLAVINLLNSRRRV